MKTLKFLLLTALSSIVMINIASASNAEVEVQFQNTSDWKIHHVFLSSANTVEWGEDQLGETVIGKNQSFTLNKIPVGTYDLKIVDEDGDECVLEDQKFTENLKADISNENLLKCQKATGKEEAED